MTTQTFDETKAEIFTDRILGVLNSGALSLMISIGHRTKLFDTLAKLPPATSQEIADSTNLNERYVREWLGAMVTGRIIDYNPTKKTYYLPPEHAAFLTRAAAGNNIAPITQFISVLGTVEDQIVDCFFQGGGVPYSQYKRFHEVMAEESAQTVVAALEEYILPLIPNIKEALEQGINVLDLGCGRGRAMNKLAERFPHSQFWGYDFSSEAIAIATAEAQQKNLTNVHFQVQDAATLDESDRYHLITTFDAIHDQAKPDVVLSNIKKALRPDGVYLMQDIHAATEVHDNLDHPIAPFLYTISCMHCMTVSLADGGMGLGTVWGQQKALQMLADAGFTRVELKQSEHDLQNDYYIVRKD